MKRRYAEKNNVLLVNITRLGDMLQATPTIAGIKNENPNAKVTVLVEKQFESVCHTLPNIDEVVSLDLGMTVRSLAREQEGIIDAYEYISEVIKDLKSRNFDFVLNMSSSAYTALLLNILEVPKRGGWVSDDEGHRVIESDWARLFASSVFHNNRFYNSLNLVDIFRCSADVMHHPRTLLFKVDPEAKQYAEGLINEAKFTNSGPLICLQAGASQGKRQWSTERFVRLVDILVKKYNARVVLTGTSKELSIIDPIKTGCNSENVYIAAGKTSIPQLGALLSISDLLVTGDTGTMHIAVGVGIPVVSMFLASAYGFETGPYSEGNIVLQPVIGCGPCNPNKSCAKPDCHDTIEPELVAELSMMRVKNDILSLPDGLADPSKVLVYRTFFDEHGFYDMKPINSSEGDALTKIRQAYRKTWLDDIGGLNLGGEISNQSHGETNKNNLLKLYSSEHDEFELIIKKAEEGIQAIERLKECVSISSIPASELVISNNRLIEIDNQIEQLGYEKPSLGLMSRMFIFAKENISGTDPIDLASQMSGVYTDLRRRTEKLSRYFHQLK